MLFDGGGVWFVNHSGSTLVSLLFFFYCGGVYCFDCAAHLGSCVFCCCDIFAIFALRASNFCSSGVGRSSFQVLPVGGTCAWMNSSAVQE